MKDHFADRMTEAVKQKGTSAVVGLDPVLEQMPVALIGKHNLSQPGELKAILAVLGEFCEKVMEIVAPIVPAVKLNIGFFERYFWPGVELYYQLIARAAQLGLLTIGDVKRGDIGSTAAAYASGHMERPQYTDMKNIVTPDSITINGFSGADGIVPFAQAAAKNGKGIFVWVRASNPSAGELQDMVDSTGQRFFERLAGQTAAIAGQPEYIGECGLSDVGMVVGGTAAAQSKQLRQQYPQTIFLVPGYGAQGATAQDCLQFVRPDGSGVLINASRSIIGAHHNPRYRKQCNDVWEKCVEQACLDMKADLKQAYQA